MKPYRYPGPRPFPEDYRQVFFGRDKEIGELCRLLRREPWFVLYGKSGLGKSSLLNAGLVPRLAAEDGMAAAFIRFYAWTPGREEQPLGIAAAALHEGLPPPPDWLERLCPGDGSLWRVLKERQLSGLEQGAVLLIFDQFEELFTFPPPAVEAFAQSLAEVFYTDIPERYRAAIEQAGAAALGQHELRRLHEPLALRVVTAIRTDRMALMQQLKPFLPNTLDVCYELRPLSRAAAEEAVLNPAYDAGDFATPRFDYEDEALDALLDFLSDGQKQDIESFQLQILCEHLEKNVVARAGRTRIAAADLADPERILENYYLDKIAEIPDEAARLAARRLIEEGLIFEEEERRLTLFEGQISRAWGVDAELLARLENAHLLRREPSLRGGYTYELSHDTLVGPVLKAKAKRRAEERQQEEARLGREQAAALAAEKAAIERKRRRALITAFIAGALVLAAAVATVFAFRQELKAVAAIKKAEEKTLIAADATAEADRQKTAAAASDSLAQEKTQIATAAEAKAILAEEIAALKEKEARTATEQALLRKKEAELAAFSAVEALLEQSREDVLRLRYGGALEKLEKAAALAGSFGPEGRTMKDSLAYELMEIAFFRHHSGSPAYEPFDLAAQLLGKPPQATQADFDAELKRLDAARTGLLQRRYFPYIQELPGGAFLMGRDSTAEEGGDDELPRHEVQLRPFGLAQTETTFWQWNLYIAAKGRDIQRYSPSWGIYGDNPAVNLDWFDACEYANWLSAREGKRPFYQIDSVGIESRRGWQVTLLPDGNGYRLPTEAEWEYAARGGPGAPYYTYAGSDDLDAVAWWDGNSRIDGVQRTRPVRQKQPVVFPSGAELYDLTGNVWEWCWDAYDESYYEEFRNKRAVNPWGPEAWNIVRLLRGGSWLYVQYLSRVSLRNWDDGNFRSNLIGFRLARH